MARPKKIKPVESEPIINEPIIEAVVEEKIQMIKKINMDKFKSVFGTGLPHAIYINKNRYRIESEEIDPNSKLYMVLKKVGVVDGE